MNEENKESSPHTLTEWIQANHNLISTLAIFATLSAFAYNLPDKNTGRFLSFLLFALALFVGVEIIVNSRRVYQGRLYWFDEIFVLTILTFAYVWVQTYYPYLLVILFFVLFILIFVVLFALFYSLARWIVSKIPWLKNKSQRMRQEYIPMGVSLLTLYFLAFFKQAILIFSKVWHFFSIGKWPVD
jgi:Ca2+/Na+ antiporter